MPLVDLIRHGQSTFNAIAREGHDPMHFDARLSELGRQQVAETRQKLLTKHYDLVLTTPLTRAIETTLGIFGGRDIPIVIEHLHREQLWSSCDVGRAPAALREEFPDLAFDHLPDIWWHDADERDPRGFAVEPETSVRERTAAFVRHLLERPEQSIAIVGHGAFFWHLTGQWLENCQILSWQPK